MTSRTGPAPQVPVLAEGRTIPKVVYQTYGSKTLPPALAENVAYIKALNPTYEHVLFDDADIEQFIGREYGPEMLAQYRRINPRYGAARADLFRYLLIYKKGGVYLDIKSRMSRPLDEIIAPDDRYLLAKWGDYHVVVHSRLAHIRRGEFQNWHVIAAPGHPFLKAVIDRVLQNIDRYRPWLHGVGKSAVLHVTGPVPYTLAIDPLLDRYPHRSVDGQEEIGLEYSAVAGETHVRLFATHYSQLEESVVMLTGPAAVLSNLYLNSGTHLMIRRVKNRLKDLRDERRARRARPVS